MFSPALLTFWDLSNTDEVLYEALVKRAAADQCFPPEPESTPTKKTGATCSSGPGVIVQRRVRT